MSKVRIIFNGKYYEYNDKEFSPDIYYDLDDEEVIELFRKRREIIKTFAANVSVLDKATNDKTSEFLTLRINEELSSLYDIEKNIDILQKQKNINLEWYHKTIPINADEVAVPEDQARQICKNCGSLYTDDFIFDFEHRTVDEINSCTCPSCGEKEVIYSQNVHIYNAEVLKNKLDYEDVYEEQLQLLDQMMEELQKVNDFDEDDLEEAKLELSMSHQRKARLLLSHCEIEKTLNEINLAISGFEYAKKRKKLYLYNYNVLSMAYIVRQTCCLELKENISMVISDGELAEECLNKYYSSNKQLCISENRLDYLEEVDKEFQYVSMMNYINMKEAKEFLGESQEEISGHIQKTMNFLSSCDKLNHDERIDFNRKLRGNINQADETIRKKEGCYIATAVYGDYGAPSVLILRRFRDEYLDKSYLGKRLIKFYYRVSPPIANKLRTAKRFNYCVKKVMDLFVSFLQKYMK